MAAKVRARVGVGRFSIPLKVPEAWKRKGALKGVVGVYRRAAHAIPVAPDGRILLVQRHSKARHAPNKWSFPSGVVDLADRNAQAAAVRELSEETNLKAGKALPLRNRLGFSVKKVHFDTVALGSYHLALVPRPGALKLNASGEVELSNSQWIAPEEIPGVLNSKDLSPATRRVLVLIGKKYPTRGALKSFYARKVK